MNAYSADSDMLDEVEEVPRPGIGDIARRSADLHATILERSSLLSSLARNGRDTDRAGEPSSLLRYFQAHRELLGPPSGGGSLPLGPPTAATVSDSAGAILYSVSVEPVEEVDFTDRIQLSFLAARLVARVQQDLSAVPDADFDVAIKEPTGPNIHWDDSKPTLTIDGELCGHLARQASSQRSIMNAFQAKNWGVEKLSNPLIEFGRDDANSLSQVVRKLNVRLGTHLEFWVSLGRVCWKRG